MNWRWDWLWSILWNAFIHAITGQWLALSRDGDDLKNWWRSFWSEIENQISGVKSWLIGYAYGLYISISNWLRGHIDWVSGRLSWLQGYAFGLYVRAVNFVTGQINWLRGHAENLVNAVYAWAQPYIAWAIAWIRPYIDQAVSWVRGLYEWVQSYRSLITGWLVSARGVIDWLWHQAAGQLQAFLSDPIGYVLGWLLAPIRNLINWWQQYGPMLQTFVANELAEWYTLWTNGKAVLKALIDNPEGFIFDALAPKFIDWAAGVIEDNW